MRGVEGAVDDDGAVEVDDGTAFSAVPLEERGAGGLVVFCYGAGTASQGGLREWEGLGGDGY